MTKKYIAQLAILLTVLTTGCEKSSDDDACGTEKTESVLFYAAELFLQPSEIYWGVTGNVRSYTYNWTFANNCSKKNPKVGFVTLLTAPNNTLSNPFSFSAGTQTCLGVQPQSAILNPTGGQMMYESSESEIGMQQCFGGQSSGTIYPYITISFTSLGSSQADSLYLTSTIDFIKATRVYSEPK